MKFPLLVTKFQIKFIIVFIAIFVIAPLARSQFTFVDWNCGDVGNYTEASTYQHNLLSHLPSVALQASVSRFGHSFVGEGFDKVHTLYNCRVDLSLQQCRDCVKQATEEMKIVERCPTSIESITWLEECMLRYANRSLLSLEEEKPYTWGYGGTFTDEPTPYLIQTVAEHIDGLIDQAAYNETAGGFATGRANVGPLDDVYFLAQCTPDILGNGCERCLRAAFKSMYEYANLGKSTPMMTFSPSCHIRYDRKPILVNGANYSPCSTSSLPILASPTPDSSLPLPANEGGSINTVKIVEVIAHIIGMLIVFDGIRNLLFSILRYLIVKIVEVIAHII